MIFTGEKFNVPVSAERSSFIDRHMLQLKQCPGVIQAQGYQVLDRCTAELFFKFAVQGRFGHSGHNGYIIQRNRFMQVILHIFTNRLQGNTGFRPLSIRQLQKETIAFDRQIFFGHTAVFYHAADFQKLLDRIGIAFQIENFARPKLGTVKHGLKQGSIDNSDHDFPENLARRNGDLTIAFRIQNIQTAWR